MVKFIQFVFFILELVFVFENSVHCNDYELDQSNSNKYELSEDYGSNNGSGSGDKLCDDGDDDYDGSKSNGLDGEDRSRDDSYDKGGREKESADGRKLDKEADSGSKGQDNETDKTLFDGTF